MNVSRSIVRGGAAVAGVAVLAVATATAAGAHVTAGPTEQPVGSYVVVTVSVPHGCDGSPTTKVRIKVPESVPQITPTINASWDVEKTEVALATPIDAGHGETIDTRVDEVVYTAKTPLPDGFRDAFELSFKTPDTPGETLTFPVIQTCEVGETAWIDVPADGESEDDLEHPAPAVELVASNSGDEHESAATDDHGDEQDVATDENAAAADESVDTDGSDPLAFAAVVVGGIAIVIGAIALARTRART